MSELREEIRTKVHSIQLAADVAVVAAQVVSQGVVLVYRMATDLELKQAAAEFQVEKQKYVTFRETSYQQMFDARQEAWEGRIATNKLLNAADDDIAKRQQTILDQFAARRADRLFYWEARIWLLAQKMAGSGDAARDLLYDPDYPMDWTPCLDSIENALDVAGMLPIVGIVPDLINVAFTAGRGKWGTAGFNLIAAIPGIGDGLKGGKLLAVAGTAGTGIIAVVIKKNGDKAFEKALKLGDDVVKHGDEAAGVVDNAVKEIDDVLPDETATELARRLGSEGENAAGIIPGSKKAIDSVLFPGRVRFPDELTEVTLREIKNVAKLSNTEQLRDYLEIARSTGRTLIIETRLSTKISGPLQKLIDEGLIIHKIIGQ